MAPSEGKSKKMHPAASTSFNESFLKSLLIVQMLIKKPCKYFRKTAKFYNERNFKYFVNADCN